MKVFKLTRHWDAGFATNSSEIGIFSSREKANAKALELEPRREIREYEYWVSEVEIQ